MTRESEAAVIAGVIVDTRHWIGGERVASAETFAGLSSIDGSVPGEISRRAEIDGFVRRALAAGARAIIGGHREGGHNYAPTLLTDVAQNSETVQEEVFGPVLTLQTFTTEAEAVASPTTPASGWPPPSRPATRSAPKRQRRPTTTACTTSATRTPAPCSV